MQQQHWGTFIGYFYITVVVESTFIIRLNIANKSMDPRLYKGEYATPIQMWQQYQTSGLKGYLSIHPVYRQLCQQLGIIFKFTENKLKIAKLDTNNHQQMKFISDYKEYYQKQQIYHFVSCENIELFIKTIESPLSFIFRECFLGNRASYIISQTSCELLQKIVIMSDPIGNQGIKKLMQLNLPKMKYLRIQNSNITTDSAKLLRHKQWKGITNLQENTDIYFGVLEQKHFNYNILFKQMTHIKHYNQLMTITGSYWFEQDTFEYWGLVSKIFASSKQKLVLVYPEKQHVLKHMTSLFTSEKTKSILSTMITMSSSFGYY